MTAELCVCVFVDIQSTCIAVVYRLRVCLFRLYVCTIRVFGGRAVSRATLSHLDVLVWITGSLSQIRSSAIRLIKSSEKYTRMSYDTSHNTCTRLVKPTAFTPHVPTIGFTLCMLGFCCRQSSHRILVWTSKQLLLGFSAQSCAVPNTRKLTTLSKCAQFDRCHSLGHCRCCRFWCICCCCCTVTFTNWHGIV